MEHKVGTAAVGELLGSNKNFRIKKINNPYPDPTTTTIVQLMLVI
jgi:hypothetical protein